MAHRDASMHKDTLAVNVSSTPKDYDHHEISTNMKTPRASNMKHTHQKAGDGLGLFDESQHNIKTSVGLNDQSGISPFSQKLFNFSGTAAN